MRGSYTAKDCLTAPWGLPEPAITNPSRSITRRRSRSGRWDVNGNSVAVGARSQHAAPTRLLSAVEGWPRCSALVGLVADRDRLRQRGERRLGVGENADLGGIVLADLLRVDVDLDQLARGQAERDPFAVARRRPVGETAPDRDHHVGVGGDAVADGGPRLPDRPGEQGDGPPGIRSCPARWSRPAHGSASASARSSRAASAEITPPPIAMTGRFASWQNPCRVCRSHQDRGAGDRLAAGAPSACSSTSAAAAWTSIGTSMCTGPGRPVSIALNARCITNGSSSTVRASK